jgi:hypothetical protein
MISSALTAKIESTRRVPIDQWADAYARQPGDIKTILTFPDAPAGGSP